MGSLSIVAMVAGVALMLWGLFAVLGSAPLRCSLCKSPIPDDGYAAWDQSDGKFLCRGCAAVREFTWARARVVIPPACDCAFCQAERRRGGDTPPPPIFPPPMKR